MDINAIAQLLHIHKEASAHGPMLKHITEVAMENLRHLEADAKEEAEGLRKERAEKDQVAKEEALAQQKAQREEDDDAAVKPRMISKEEIEPQSEPTIRRPAPDPTIVDRRL